MEYLEKENRRKYGLHITSTDIFEKFIFPEIKGELKDFIWVDLFAGEGNLILPILNEIPTREKQKFFKRHIYLFDVRKEMVQKCVKNAEPYGISKKLAQENIFNRDNLKTFPEFLKQKDLPIYHITNPPYLYLGYIRKHYETQKYLKYFQEENEGYQDLYQIAMINDLRNEIENLIYIIPSNFLFGASVSNKFRLDFLKHYKILKMIIFETKIFEFTGTNICIGFFKKKKTPKDENLAFPGIKIKKKKKILKKNYILKSKYKYRAGSEFDAFLDKYRISNPLKVEYYLMKKEVNKNLGNFEIDVIDANQYKNNEYKKLKLRINDNLKHKIDSNILYVRTVDTGSQYGRVALGFIKDDFNVNGIYVSGNTYRTHPIQIFLKPLLSIRDQLLLKDYFNFMLESFRGKLDSEFLTTYKYSEAKYTRKYLGLTQTRKLIETFPYSENGLTNKDKIYRYIQSNRFDKMLEFLKTCKNESN